MWGDLGTGSLGETAQVVRKGADGTTMQRRADDGGLGCWYPVGGLERLCRCATDGAPTGLCAEHARRLYESRRVRVS